MGGCVKYVPRKGNAQVLDTKSATTASSTDYRRDGFDECLRLATIMISYSSCGFLNRTLYLVFKLMTPLILYDFFSHVHSLSTGCLSRLLTFGCGFLYLLLLE